MDHQAVLSALSYGKEDAMSMKEIAEAMGLEITSYIDWIRAERGLARSLRALIKWGWVARKKRQREDGRSSGITHTGRLSWQGNKMTKQNRNYIKKEIGKLLSERCPGTVAGEKSKPTPSALTSYPSTALQP